MGTDRKEDAAKAPTGAGICKWADTPAIERIALLKEILNRLDDNSPRFAFADWLEDNATTDWDVATREFIKLSCRSSSTSRITGEASRWLHTNWWRLIPYTLWHHVKANGEEEQEECHTYKNRTDGDGIKLLPNGHTVSYKFKSADITTYIRVVSNPHRSVQSASYLCSCTFHFRRGFLQELRMFSAWGMARVQSCLAVDQPVTYVSVQVSRETGRSFLRLPGVGMGEVNDSENE